MPVWRMVKMPDYEIFAPTDALMQTALTALGVKAAASGKMNGVVYAVDYYGTKYLNGVAQTGRYANLRYRDAAGFTLSAPLTSQGVTMAVQAAPFYKVWLGPTV
jgi:hypothetical protein